MAGKAKDNLERLRSGISRETPATRTRTETRTGWPEGQESEGPRSSAEGRAAKERTVRLSVDVPRPLHKFLRDYAYDQETDGMSVVRALLEELRENPQLAAKVRRRVAGL